MIKSRSNRHKDSSFLKPNAEIFCLKISYVDFQAYSLKQHFSRSRCKWIKALKAETLGFAQAEPDRECSSKNQAPWNVAIPVKAIEFLVGLKDHFGALLWLLLGHPSTTGAVLSFIFIRWDDWLEKVGYVKILSVPVLGQVVNPSVKLPGLNATTDPTIKIIGPSSLQMNDCTGCKTKREL